MEAYASAGGEGEEGLDWEAINDALGFVWRSSRRRPVLASSIFIVVAGLGLTLAATMPKLYNSSVKLLAQRDLVGPALSNPGRAVPREADNPTHSAADSIMRRDNVIALIQELNLLERWHATRPRALRFKDTLFEKLYGPASEEDRLRGLAQTLEKRMSVLADDTSITISVDWQDPETAYELVSLVEKNFVEARYNSDVTAIQDAITVLDNHTKAEAEQVDAALAAYLAAMGSTHDSAPQSPNETTASTPPRAPTANVGRQTPASDPEVLKSLEDTRSHIRTFEEEHQRELASLRQQLTQAQLTLTPQHPTVIALEQQVQALSEPSPEFEQLKNQERSLLSQLELAAPPSSSAGGQSATLSRLAAIAPGADARPGAPEREDPALAPIHSRLNNALLRYQELMGRLDGANLELEIMRATFRHRYSVVTPAEVARGPKRPLGLMIGAGSLVMGVILAFLGAAAADWRTRLFLETWQVHRRLKIDVLGEIERL